MARKNFSGGIKNNTWLLLNIPAFLSTFIVLLIPFGYAVYISFFHWKLSNPPMRFIGFGGYTKLFKDPIFIKSLNNTLFFTVSVVFLTCLFGLLVAIIINRPFKGKDFFRAAIFIPWAIMPIAIGLLWSWIFNSRFGVFNYLLLKMGLIKEYIPILGSEKYAMYSVIVACVWRNIPFAALLIMAGLQAIPKECYEAATVDGASKFQIFLHITLPLLRSSLLLVVTFITMVALRIFDIIYSMTAGGPAHATTVLGWYTYSTSFLSYDLGKGARIGIVIAVITMIFALIYIKIFYTKRVEY